MIGLPDLFIPRVRTTMAHDRSFASIRPSLWNHLYLLLFAHSFSLRPFPRLSRLKSYLFPGTEMLLFGLHREKRYINLYIKYNAIPAPKVVRSDRSRSEDVLSAKFISSCSIETFLRTSSSFFLAVSSPFALRTTTSSSSRRVFNGDTVADTSDANDDDSGEW